MKKKLWISVIFLVLIITCAAVYIRFNLPLEIGTLAATKDQKSVVVGIGNKGLGEIKIVEVTVNNSEKPMNTRLQVSNALQGFVITDHETDEETEKFGFTDIEKAIIKTGTSPSSNFEKLDKGTAEKNDEIYGISVFHNEEINKVHIKYNYLGISFNDTVIMD